MKKILLIGCLLLAAATVHAAVFSTNMTAGATLVGKQLIAGRANVYSITVTAPSDSVTVRFYDQNSLVDPYFGTNYVTAAYVSRASYASNIVTSYVGQSGFTNWYTNSYIYTLQSTNAATTNAMSPSQVISVSRGFSTTIDTDLLFNRGVVATATTNADIVINYNLGQ